MQKFKKIITVFVLLLVVSFSFVGCGDEVDDTFYRNTSTKFNDFVESLCLNADYENGVTYEQNVNSILQSIGNQTDNPNEQKYTELKSVYDSIFVASFHFLEAFSNTLSVAPIEVNADVQNAYLDFENQIDVVTEQFNEFENDIHELDITIVTTDPFGIISMQSLRDYKRSLIDLCQEIVRLDNMFISLCENYIYPTYDSFKDAEGNYLELDATALRNQKNLANLKSVVATITPAIEYLNAFDGNYTQHDTDKIFTTLNSYADIEIAGSSESQTTTVEELDMFLKVYAYYQNDLECFYTSLENVNFREFQNSNFDPQVYAKDDAQKFAYASKILSFTNQSVLNLYEINIALCN